jgi:uncharacterized membrane protein YGL010W
MRFGTVTILLSVTTYDLNVSLVLSTSVSLYAIVLFSSCGLHCTNLLHICFFCTRHVCLLSLASKLTARLRLSSPCLATTVLCWVITWRGNSWSFEIEMVAGQLVPNSPHSLLNTVIVLRNNSLKCGVIKKYFVRKFPCAFLLWYDKYLDKNLF